MPGSKYRERRIVNPEGAMPDRTAAVGAPIPRDGWTHFARSSNPFARSSSHASEKPGARIATYGDAATLGKMP